MADIVHNGAAFWNELNERSQDFHDYALDGYFVDAQEHIRPPSKSLASALDNWQRILHQRDPGDRRSPWEQLRAYAEAADPAQASAPCRCIFVSHRQADSDSAVHLAKAILAYNPLDSDPYDVWLDVWDPALNRPLPIADLNHATLTALIIEMGLISSVAVIALMTDGSHGSSWIPYEFGRVKTGGPFAREASTCLQDLSRPLHDYMLLAPKIRRRRDGRYDGLHSWLNSLC